MIYWENSNVFQPILLDVSKLPMFHFFQFHSGTQKSACSAHFIMTPNSGKIWILTFKGFHVKRRFFLRSFSKLMR